MFKVVLGHQVTDACRRTESEEILEILSLSVLAFKLIWNGAKQALSNTFLCMLSEAIDKHAVTLIERVEKRIPLGQL